MQRPPCRQTRAALSQASSGLIQCNIVYLEYAVRLAPYWPLAYVGLADNYLGMSRWASMRPSEAVSKARAAASKALDLDNSLGEAHFCLAWIATTYDWDWPLAERQYKL